MHDATSTTTLVGAISSGTIVAKDTLHYLFALGWWWWCGIGYGIAGIGNGSRGIIHVVVVISGSGNRSRGHVFPWVIRRGCIVVHGLYYWKTVWLIFIRCRMGAVKVIGCRVVNGGVVVAISIIILLLLPHWSQRDGWQSRTALRTRCIVGQPLRHTIQMHGLATTERGNVGMVVKTNETRPGRGAFPEPSRQTTFGLLIVRRFPFLQ